ncbi:MAG: hypothetical protein Q9P14_12215 [candidate division KSB1 bacterium]|nr:hypothetical protein [candidate division KSB1 bacterium]MDQ7065939.1 hypothetical protein [candidate division KSB1 bacterium]
MEQIDFKRILKQIEEIQALFIIAQRIAPYFKELIQFIQETTPIIEEMKNSILESSKKMPAALEQLDKITAATETATVDILDRLDQMQKRVDNALTSIQKIKSNLRQDSEEPLNRTSDLTELEQLEQDILEIQNETFDIMNLLQVQDITTQQIMAANSLIESVQGKLEQLTSRFGRLETQPDIDLYAPESNVGQDKQRAFDPNATFEDRSDVQAMADAILTQSVVSEQPRSEKESNQHSVDNTEMKNDAMATQEEIDKLFDHLK